MKKLLFWVLPLFILACSLFSYQICKDQINQLKLGPNKINISSKVVKGSALNRPKALSALCDKTVIVVCNGIDVDMFNILINNNFPSNNKVGIRGIILNEPINDSKLTIIQLLSGFKPEFSGYISKKNNTLNGSQVDDLFKVASDNKRRIKHFDSQQSNSSMEEFTLTIKSWSENDLLFFDFSNQIDWQQWSENFLKPIINKLTENDQFIICSLIPENSSKPFSGISKQYQSPFYYFGKSILYREKPVTINIEDLTATISFSLGLPLPSDCLGYPDHSFFSIPPKEKIVRTTYSIENFIMNSVRLFYNYQVNDSIIAGYLIESNDQIHLTQANTIEEIDKQFNFIYREFISFVTESRQKNNLLLSIIFLVFSVILTILWLLLFIKEYRSFFFGFIMIGIYFLFQYIVFRIPMSLPQIELMSIRWFFFHFGIPFLLTGILISILYTILGGYAYDIKLDEILTDMNSIIGTFGLFLVCETALIINFYGFKINFTSPGYFIETILLRDFSLIILLIIVLITMYSFSFLTYKLLSKYGPKQD